MPTSLDDPRIGRILDGRYRVTQRLAEGGMATVYLAIDERLDREVAVKVMRAQYAFDDSYVTRFKREARAAASLSHPNVVPVFDQGRDGEDVFLAMEYVPGHTLRDVLAQNGALTPRQAFGFLDPMLEALSAAHEAGIVHRDVKPENILISPSGAVKVTDFGLARAVTSKTVTSASDQILGTVAYLAPEQVENGVADVRSDVYASGLVLLEMLTGEKAFDGETAIHVAYQHVQGDVPRPSSRVETLPTELDDLVAAATARDPADRPEDAAAFLALARDVYDDLDDVALDTPPPQQRLVEVAPLDYEPADAWDDDSPLSHTRVVASPHAGAAPSNLVGAQTAGGSSRRLPTVSRRAWLAAGAAAVFAGGTAWVFTVGPGASVTVPDATGLSLDAATTLLKDRNLSVSSSTAFSEDVPKGDVISQQPQSGETARRDAEVALVVSKGKERYAVPSLAKMPYEDAIKKLTEGNLKAGKVTSKFSDSLAAGLIISTSPKAGTQLKKDSAVALVISKGRQRVAVPDMRGKPLAEATAAFKEAGLKVGKQTQDFSDQVPSGSVINQSTTGTVFKGDTIDLVISKGRKPFKLPNVVGDKVVDATKELERLGLNVKQKIIGNGGLQRVQATDPTADSLVRKGDTVTLMVV